jgi:hypothetical protein
VLIQEGTERSSPLAWCGCVYTAVTYTRDTYQVAAYVDSSTIREAIIRAYV